MNKQYGVDVPLILMNSFNTDEETAQIIQKYAGHGVRIITFNQSRFPRFSKDALRPIPTSFESDKNGWYPPGHGDLYESFYRSGVLEDLLKAGKEYVFVSNIDNLGAIVNQSMIFRLMCPFL